MAKIENECLIVKLPQVDGASLRKVQTSLVVAMERIAECDDRDSDECQEAIYWLGQMLRSSLLDESQTNVGLGGNPYSQKLSVANG